MCSPLKITSWTESLETHSPTNTPTHTFIQRSQDQYLVCACVFILKCVFLGTVLKCVWEPFEQSLKYLFT